MESWFTSSVEEGESALISRRLGSTELSSNCCTEIDLPLELTQVSQGISEVA